MLLLPFQSHLSFMPVWASKYKKDVSVPLPWNLGKRRNPRKKVGKNQEVGKYNTWLQVESWVGSEHLCCVLPATCSLLWHHPICQAGTPLTYCYLLREGTQGVALLSKEWISLPGRSHYSCLRIFCRCGTLGISSCSLEVNIWSKTLTCCSSNFDNILF